MRVLLTLAAGQFLMILDSSVMNVSMASVAADLDTPITGIQTAITLYTLVMATLMVTGGKLGARLGQRRAFAAGLVVYGCGSATTALAPNLAVLLVGWSVLEGLGAVLILPAIVALVAGNCPREKRAAAYGFIAAAGASAVAAGPLIGGTVTTYGSWRYVFAGEVGLVVVILALVRGITAVAPAPVRLDPLGSVLSALGLGTLVFAVLRSSEWGWVRASPAGPHWFGLSPVIWLLLLSSGILYVFLCWERHLSGRGREPLVDLALFGNRGLTGGLSMFFAQFMIQAGVFFAVPLYLSVVLELSALDTGLRVLPLSAALVLAALGIPWLRPRADPRRVVRAGLLAMIAGIVVLVAGLDPGADARVVTAPMLLLGLGLGALSSQLGAVTVTAVPDSRSDEVGGLQNTATNLGASLGTALIGSILFTMLSAAALSGIDADPNVPESVRQQAGVRLAEGVPFVSNTELSRALTGAAVPEPTAAAIVEVNTEARLTALRAALAVTALIAAVALFGTGRLPRTAAGTDGGAPPE
ncbi:MFS transporter [Nocardia inohanensis]|uniref:MFS transporter n=1 Tax=Nocardia inohanensis TaxID=209246 RepID=UPI0008298DE7|nr:MFS transporter [Nocardia inohanensis]